MPTISRLSYSARAAALALTLATVTVAACSSSDSRTSGGASSAVPAVPGAPAGAAGAPGAPATTADATPACRLEGDWTACAIEDRLTHSGVVFTKKPDAVTLPFLSVPGIAYEIGNPEHEVQVFLYPSVAARERETATLDSASASPKGARHAWRTPPTLVTSNNMAAVILSLNDRTVERLALALGAGLPQPEKR